MQKLTEITGLSITNGKGIALTELPLYSDVVLATSGYSVTDTHTFACIVATHGAGTVALGDTAAIDTNGDITVTVALTDTRATRLMQQGRGAVDATVTIWDVTTASPVLYGAIPLVWQPNPSNVTVTAL